MFLSALFAAGYLAYVPAVFAQTAASAPVSDVPAELQALADELGCDSREFCEAAFKARAKSDLSGAIALTERHRVFENDPEKQRIAQTLRQEVLTQLSETKDDEEFDEKIVAIANDILRRNPAAARRLNIDRASVRAAEIVAVEVKNAGASLDVCSRPASSLAPAELESCLTAAKKLAEKKDAVKAYVAEEQFDKTDQGDSNLRFVQALREGRYQCGDNTAGGCGEICLRPDSPAVCSQIAQEMFGPEGVRELARARQQVERVERTVEQGVSDLMLTLPDGAVIRGHGAIRDFCDRAFRNRNIKDAEACGAFAVRNNLAAAGDVEDGVRFLKSFAEKADVSVAFGECAANPDDEKCGTFVPDDYRGAFSEFRSLEEIMRRNLGFDLRNCERANAETEKLCLDGTKKAVSELRTAGFRSREVLRVVADIERRVSQAEKFSQKREQFRATVPTQGAPSDTPQTFEGWLERCKDPKYGAECIAAGASFGLIERSDALRRFEEYTVRTQAPSFAVPIGERVDRTPSGILLPGQAPGVPASPSQIGDRPSQACLGAIADGDFRLASELCPRPRIQEPAPCPALSTVSYCRAGERRIVTFSSPQCGTFYGCEPERGSQPSPQYCPQGQYWDGRTCMPQGGTPGCGFYNDPSQTNRERRCVEDPRCEWDRGMNLCIPHPEGDRPACSDGRDNDGDGRSDFGQGPGNDPGCYGPEDRDEYNPVGTPVQSCPQGTYFATRRDNTTYCASNSVQENCTNGVDDDGDQFVDAEDPACGGTPGPSPASTGQPQCSNGRDDDNDGRTDYPADVSCYGPDDNDEWYPQSGGASPTPGTGTMQRCFYPNASINGQYPGFTVWCERDYYNCHEGSPSGRTIGLTGLSLGAPSSCESGWTGGGGACTGFTEATCLAQTGCRWNAAGSPGCSSTAGPTPSSQREQIWNTRGLRSWIRSDADPARINELRTACANVAGGANVWMSGAGTFSSPDFGMPDPAKCPLAANCTSSQYFNGANCVASASTGCPSGQYWNGSSCVTNIPPAYGDCRLNTSQSSCTVQPGCRWFTVSGGSYCEGDNYIPSTCDAALTALLGTGCHFMYTDSAGNPIFCSSAMDRSAKRGDTVTTAGCTGPGGYSCGTYATQSTCNAQSGCYWSNNVCIATGGGTPSPSPSPGGTPSPMPTPSPGTSASPTPWPSSSPWSSPSPGGGSCSSGQYWYYPPGGGAGYCTSSSCPSGQYWYYPPGGGAGYCVSSSPSPSPSGSGSCPSGQYWYYPPGGGAAYCTSSSPSPSPSFSSCPSGQYWYYPSGGGAAYCTSSSPSPSPSSSSWPCSGYTEASCVSEPGCYWNNGCSSVPPSSPTPTPTPTSTPTPTPTPTPEPSPSPTPEPTPSPSPGGGGGALPSTRFFAELLTTLTGLAALLARILGQQ